VSRRQRLGTSYRIAVSVLRPMMRLLTRHEWSGEEHLPAEGGFVVCVNHISYSDPIAFAHFLYDNGHPPYFLAKEALFRIPVVGRVIRGAGQIPVFRGTTDAVKAFSAAVEAVNEGKCVAVYPEATITKDPQLWPMTGKTGAARIALATKCPVIPVAQWGPQELLPPSAKRPRVLPRKTMQVVAGPPVDLTDLQDQRIDAALLETATVRIMAAITDLLKPLRPGDTPPSVPYDGRQHRPKGGAA
jgi:1-acyl-sn-glycerol-3-phosphate acyltransferase